jgi:hypothetical protein
MNIPEGGTTGGLAEKLHGLFIFFVVHVGVPTNMHWSLTWQLI